MTMENLCQRYLAALNNGNLEEVLALFTPDAVVESPLYGRQAASVFYAALFADTRRSVTTLSNIFVPVNAASSLALHFHYTWTLQSGKQVQFECVDVFELAPGGDKFTRLKIIYDTAPLRADFDASKAASLLQV
ncbi:MAG: nuclear transport factor 2 family protein [Burkholderiales bacterium]|nr:nuclear transport factor 2 family protein [Burkholderiales bacterium]